MRASLSAALKVRSIAASIEPPMRPSVL